MLELLQCGGEWSCFAFLPLSGIMSGSRSPGSGMHGCILGRCIFMVCSILSFETGGYCGSFQSLCAIVLSLIRVCACCHSFVSASPLAVMVSSIRQCVWQTQKLLRTKLQFSFSLGAFVLVGWDDCPSVSFVSVFLPVFLLVFVRFFDSLI